MDAGTQQNEWAFKSRLFIGQIESVPEDGKQGVVSVRIGATHDKLTTTIPMGGLSMNGAFSSWMRYMPTPGDYVVCGYGPRNELEILSYTAWGTARADDSNSYTGNLAQRVRAEGYGRIASDADADTNNLRIFRALRPGEFDARSYGGAGFWASREGVFTVEAGETTFVFSKDEVEARLRTDLVVEGGDGVEVRFGNVKRKTVPTDTQESTVLPNLASSPQPKEHRVNVGFLVPPTGLELTLAWWNAGDLRDSLGVPILNTNTGLPDRFKAQFYDPSGVVPLVTTEIDVAGNVRIASSTTLTLATDLPASIHFGSFTSFEPFMKGATWATASIARDEAINAALATEGGLDTANAVTYTAISTLTGTLAANLIDPISKPTSIDALDTVLSTYFTALAAFFAQQGVTYYTPKVAVSAAKVAANVAFDVASVPGSILSLKILGE